MDTIEFEAESPALVLRSVTLKYVILAIVEAHRASEAWYGEKQLFIREAAKRARKEKEERREARTEGRLARRQGGSLAGAAHRLW